MMTVNKDRVAVVAKAPELGIVKTRIGAVWGAKEALKIYKVLFEYTLACVGGVCADKFLYLDRIVPYPIPEVFRLYTQCEGDIGVRMQAVFRTLLKEGASRVVVVGSDCPYLKAAHIEQALDLLGMECDVVIGPAKDGGYYLIGMSKLYVPLFENKRWSTSSVLSDTLADAARLGLRVKLLACLSDVDTAEDWLGCPLCSDGY